MGNRAYQKRERNEMLAPTGRRKNPTSCNIGPGRCR